MFCLRLKCPEARQRAVPRHFDKFCLLDHNINVVPAAPVFFAVMPAGKDPLAGNRSAIFLDRAVDGLTYFQVFRNIIRAAVDDRASFGKRYLVCVQLFFRRAFTGIHTCPLILHRMCGGKAGVDGLHAFAAHVIAVRRLAADELIFVAVDLLIPAHEFVACISRRSHGDAFTGRSKIVLCRRVVRYGLAHVADDLDRAAVRILPKISAHLAVLVLHARGGDKALAPLPLGDERCADGFELRRLAICRKGKGFAFRVIAHGVDRGQHFIIILWQQPAVEAPAILCCFGSLRRIRSTRRQHAATARLLRKGDRICSIVAVGILSAVGLIYDHRLFDKDQHDIRRFLHTVLIGVRIAFFSPFFFVCHRNEHLLQTFRRLARDIRADKLNIAVFRFDRLHLDGAAVSHYQL